MSFQQFVDTCAWAAAITWAIAIPLILARQAVAWRWARDGAGSPARTLIAGLFVTGVLSAVEAFALWWLIIYPPATRLDRMTILALILIVIVLRGMSYLAINLRVLGRAELPMWRRGRES